MVGDCGWGVGVRGPQVGAWLEACGRGHGPRACGARCVVARGAPRRVASSCGPWALRQPGPRAPRASCLRTRGAWPEACRQLRRARGVAPAGHRDQQHLCPLRDLCVGRQRQRRRGRRAAGIGRRRALVGAARAVAHAVRAREAAAERLANVAGANDTDAHGCGAARAAGAGFDWRVRCWPSARTQSRARLAAPRPLVG